MSRRPNEGHEDPPSLQSRAIQPTSNESHVIWVCDMTQYASRKANPPKPRKSYARVMYDMTHSHCTEWVICDMSMWHDSIYIPKAQSWKVLRVTWLIHIELRLCISRKPNPPKPRMSCTGLMYMKKGVYISRKPNLHLFLFDYIYPIPKAQSSKVSNLMYMSHVWHDSFTLYRMSHMWQEYLTCDMTQYTFQSLECHMHESCVTWLLSCAIDRVIRQMTCVSWLNINPESPIPESLESHTFLYKRVSHPICAYRCDVETPCVHVEVTTSPLAPSQHVIPQWHSAHTICSKRITNQPIVCRITDLCFF